MYDKIRNFLLFAGVDHTNYHMVLPKIKQTNRLMLTIASGFATVIIFVMLLLSFFVEGVKSNRLVYMIGFFTILIHFILSTFVAKKHDKLIKPLVYISYSIFYIYGISIGIFTDPDQKTVTFIVMLVLLPMLYIDRPIHSAFLSTCYVVIFIALCLERKTGSVLSNDIIDAIVFGSFGAFINVICSHHKIQGFIQQQELQEISRIDVLTKMNNQNAFKLDLYSMHRRYRHSLACVYIDVNGLHDLNNDEGHAAGDALLQYVAKQIVKCFGHELTYRCGGDEFVAFCPDMDRERLNETIEYLVSEVEKAGYSIAIGYDITRNRLQSINELVDEADFRMQANKNSSKKGRK